MLWLICYVIKLSVSFVFCLYEYKYNEIKKSERNARTFLNIMKQKLLLDDSLSVRSDSQLLASWDYDYLHLGISCRDDNFSAVGL